jgi:Mg2+ and Co2+ transporter CorA
MPDYFEIPIVETTAAEYDVAQEEQYNKVGINFDALRKLFGSEDQDVEEEPLEEIRLHSSYRFGAKNLPPARTQRVILYSGSTENSFHGHTFKELNISTKALWDTFGSREEGDVYDPWWLDVQNPTESELRLLCSALRVHPLTVEDILNQETREKIDDYTTYYYVCFWSCRIEVDGDGKETYKPYNTYMVVFPTGTLSISYAESEHPDKVLERIKLLQDYVAINSDWIFYAFV